MSLNKFSFIKKKSQIGPHLISGEVKFERSIIDEKTLRKPKGERARETQTLEGMSKSKVKVAIKKKRISHQSDEYQTFSSCKPYQCQNLKYF